MHTGRHLLTRRGFTAIELTIVIGIMLVLITMTVRGTLPALRKAAVEQGVEAIGAAASQARLLALKSVASTDGGRYGVVVMRDDDGRLYAGVVHGRPGDGKAKHAERLLDPRARRELPESVMVWIGELELGDPSGESELAWYYEPATGLPVIFSGASFSSPGASVGTSEPDLSAEYGMRTRVLALPILAPSNGDTPGLTVRSRDQRVRRSIIVEPSSAFVVSEY